MSDLKIIHLPIEDEWPHTPGPQDLWQESVVLAFQDIERKLGGYIRIGHQPNRHLGRLTFGLISPGNRYTRALEDVPMRESDRFETGFAIEDFVRANFTETGSHWRASNEECEIDLHVTNVHKLFDVMAYRHGGGDFHKEFNSHHTEVAGLAKGRMRIGDEHYDIDGFCFRDHSWGVRNLENPNALPTNMFWLIGSFGPDFIYSIAEVVTLAGTRLPLGFIIKDGEFDTPQTQDISFEIELDGVTTRGMKIGFTTPKFGRFDFAVEGFGNVLLALGPRYLESGMPSIVRWNDRVTGGHVSSMFNARAGTATPHFLIGTSPRNGLYRAKGFLGDWPRIESRLLTNKEA